jgi:hypothetical protein
MKHKNLIVAALFSAIALWCACDGREVTPGDPKKSSLGWGLENGGLPIDAGTCVVVSIRSFPLFMGESVPYARLIHEGPGELYYYYAPNDFSGTRLIPWDEIKDGYRGNGVFLYYRAPYNDDVPPEGVDVLFACEVLSPFSEKWERSPDYVNRINRRDRPADYFILHRGHGYEPSAQPKSVEIAAGTAYRFSFHTYRTRTLEDIQARGSLIPPEGYTGSPGSLNVKIGANCFNSPPLHPEYYDCFYDAPEDVAEPVDIVACITYYDHWVKEWIDHKFTIQLVPKE